MFYCELYLSHHQLSLAKGSYAYLDTKNSLEISLQEKRTVLVTTEGCKLHPLWPFGFGAGLYTPLTTFTDEIFR